MNKENLNLFQQIVQAHNITCTIVEKDFETFSSLDQASADLNRVQALKTISQPSVKA